MIMRALVIIATDIANDDSRKLLPGDRAAAFWGVTLAGADCRVQVPDNDRAPLIYANAVGAKNQPWLTRLEPQPDLVLIGPGAINRLGDAFAGRLAYELSAELLFDALQVRREVDAWRVVCDAGRGAQDIVSVSGPVVLVVSEDAPRPPYVSRFRLTLADRSIPIVVGEAIPRISWQPVIPRAPRSTGMKDIDAATRVNGAFGIQAGVDRPRDAVIVAEEPAVCAQVLLRYLVHHGFISRPLRGPLPGIVSAPSPQDREQVSESAQVVVSDQSSNVTLLRGPRRPGDSVQRMNRRPRNVSRPSCRRDRTVRDRLRRKPRRLEAGRDTTERGPFPIRADCQKNKSSSAGCSPVDDLASR